MAAPLAGSGKMGFCCEQLDVTLSALPGAKTGVTEKGFLGCTSAHAQVRSASTMVPSPKTNSTTDRTHDMDYILVYSALLLWHTKVSVFF